MFPRFLHSVRAYLPGLAVLAVLTLAGWWASQPLGLPGPVIGLAAYVALLLAFPALERSTQAAAEGLLKLLGLLITPAAVGLALHADTLRSEVGRLALVVVLSTVATGVATMLAYKGLRKWLG
ncbi:CidA/LrgA family protein [Pedomonas mirosovicensis]|uniref:CidA/LrgA family protein n=1 Tax=Pedomonas mirosovicensis TaxID=2908641 RepID=UPI0021690807|nr:CidA/LrgA family protein [Pedomonas mirosovicensis]MCH8683847.1 CidA/LrgA family protein [Pedomonas mirosovicensis]